MSLAQDAGYAIRWLRALPGVEQAGMAVTLPIGGDDFSAPVTLSGQAAPAAGPDVSPGYFDTMGIALIAGRDVSPADAADSPAVAVVNRTFARTRWTEGTAVGRRFHIGTDTSGTPVEIVGVVEDVRHLGPARAPRPEFYRPYFQSSFSFMAVAVRAHGDPAGLVPDVRRAMLDLDPTLPLARVMTMADHLRGATAQPRSLAVVVSTFTGLALVLAAIGVYGVLAWSVAQRTTELGVRLALGARPAALMTSVLRDGLVLAGIGITLGIGGALALSRFVEALLFQVTPSDPAVYALACAVLLATATLGNVLPAWRAMRVDPLVALRTE